MRDWKSNSCMFIHFFWWSSASVTIDKGCASRDASVLRRNSGGYVRMVRGLRPRHHLHIQTPCASGHSFNFKTSACISQVAKYWQHSADSWELWYNWSREFPWVSPSVSPVMIDWRDKPCPKTMDMSDMSDMSLNLCLGADRQIAMKTKCPDSDESLGDCKTHEELAGAVRGIQFVSLKG